MRPIHWLLAAFSVLSIVYAIGLLFDSPLLPSSGVLAWVALFGYALLAGGRAAPRRVRVAVLVGLLALGALALVEFDTSRKAPSNGAGWFAYGPYPQELTPAGPEGFHDWAQLRTTVLLLLGYGCLAVALLARPGRRSRRAALLGAVVGAVVGVALTYVSLASRLPPWNYWRIGLLPELALAAASIVLVVGAFALAGTAVARGGGLLPAIGTVLIAITTPSHLYSPLLWEAVFRTPWPGTLLQEQEAVTVVTSTDFAVTPSAGPTILALAQLAGAATVTVGLLRPGGGVTGADGSSGGDGGGGGSGGDGGSAGGSGGGGFGGGTPDQPRT